jgi:hypothetical protein
MGVVEPSAESAFHDPRFQRCVIKERIILGRCHRLELIRACGAIAPQSLGTARQRHARGAFRRRQERPERAS